MNLNTDKSRFLGPYYATGTQIDEELACDEVTRRHAPIAEDPHFADMWSDDDEPGCLFTRPQRVRTRQAA